jgi:hypothetical protein
MSSRGRSQPSLPQLSQTSFLKMSVSSSSHRGPDNAAHSWHCISDSNSSHPKAQSKCSILFRPSSSPKSEVWRSHKIYQYSSIIWGNVLTLGFVLQSCNLHVCLVPGTEKCSLNCIKLVKKTLNK